MAYSFDQSAVCLVSATLPPCVALGYCSGPQVAVVMVRGLLNGTVSVTVTVVKRPGIGTDKTGQSRGAAATMPAPLDTWGTAIGVRH